MDSSLPEEFLRSLQHVPGFAEESFVAVHNRREEVVSVRFNPLKIQSGFQQVFPGCEKVPWSSFGYYLPSRPSFTLDPFLHAGVYYVQEASGMFIEQCIRQHADVSSPLKVLDLCAAPGGKSTLLQSVINPESLLVSNEVIKPRVNILTENIIKWGGANVIVTNNDPKHFARLENFFDVMVVDAPCSGSGLFRRDTTAISEWSPEAVDRCSLRQQRILTDSYACLKKGGLLIYSTCSYSKEEDEDICDWMMQEFSLSSLPVNTNPDWNIVETQSNRGAAAYRFFPDKLKGEGFFVACFRKEDGEEESVLETKKKRLTKASTPDRTIAERWINREKTVDVYYHDDVLFAFPGIHSDALAAIHSTLYTKNAGVVLGKIMKGELVPDHQLAVSELVNKNLVRILLKKDQALQYLRREEVTISTGIKGWALAEYENQNLGWLKVLGNRMNNYYPKEWRILKSGNN